MSRTVPGVKERWAFIGRHVCSRSGNALLYTVAVVLALIILAAIVATILGAMWVWANFIWQPVFRECENIGWITSNGLVSAPLLLFLFVLTVAVSIAAPVGAVTGTYQLVRLYYYIKYNRQLPNVHKISREIFGTPTRRTNSTVRRSF